MNGNQQRSVIAEDARLAMALVQLVMFAAALPLEISLRRCFGQRYLTLGRMAAGFIFLLWFIPSSPLMRCYIWVYLALCAYHKLSILRRTGAGLMWHSMEGGLSWPFWGYIKLRERPLSRVAVQVYLEPASCAALSLLVSRFDWSFANFLLLSSVMLFGRGRIVSRYWQERMLDLVDNAEDAETLAQSLRGLKEHGDQSHHVRPANPGQPPGGTSSLSPDLSDAISHLDPKLQSLLRSKHQTRDC